MAAAVSQFHGPALQEKLQPLLLTPTFTYPGGGTKVQGTVLLDKETLLRDYSIDKSHHPSAMPRAVVFPSTAEEVVQIVRFCYKNEIPFLARGAGSGLEGGAIPYFDPIIIDTIRFRRCDIDLQNGNCWVGAGVKKLELNKELAKVNCLFGPDPASNPSLGGMASTSGSGMSTIRYGTTRENILAFKVVTAQGQLIESTRRIVRKSSTGLDLTHLFVGSEGTLGIVLEICVKIHRLQRCHVGGLVTFADTDAAVRAVVDLRLKLSSGLSSLVRCELLNTNGVIASNKEHGIDLKPAPTILLELENDDVADTARTALKRDFDKIVEIFNPFHPISAQFYPTPEAMDRVWEARRGCMYAAFKFRGVKGEKVYNTDTCVPISRLAECVTQTEADFAAVGVPCIICAHIADGNFHCMIPFKTEKEFQVAEQLEHRLSKRGLALGGSVSGEHGVGVGKVKHLEEEHGVAHTSTQELIKSALDPKGLLNPGKFYPGQYRKLKAHRRAQSAHL